MTPEQWQWLYQVGLRISSLLQAIEIGNMAASTVIGERNINGRTVRLKLIAEVVDPGADPLQSHASTNFPAPAIQKPDSIITPVPRNRKRSKRW